MIQVKDYCLVHSNNMGNLDETSNPPFAHNAVITYNVVQFDYEKQIFSTIKPVLQSTGNPV